MNINFPFRFASIVYLAAALLPAMASAQSAVAKPAQIHDLKITVLSTMLVGDQKGIGEWGFAALVEADGHRILVDTGARPDTVRQNAHELGVDLSNVREVVLTHNHGDHAGGLLTLRRELMKKNPDALSIVHVGKGIFYSRPSAGGEDNDTLLIRNDYEATRRQIRRARRGRGVISGRVVFRSCPEEVSRAQLERKG